MAEIDLGLVAVLAVAVFFLVWYYAAYVYSRGLVGRIGTELKQAVLGFGGTTRIRWFGTTAFRMTTEGASPPFRGLSVTVTLRPREMPINWAIGTAQGRRDTALVEASLREDPRVGFELVDPLTRIGRRRARAKSDWRKLSLAGRELLLSADDEMHTRRILEALERDALNAIVAVHVTAGSEPGIAAAVSIEAGQTTRGLSAIRALAERLAV